MENTPFSNPENLVGKVVQFGKKCIRIVGVSAGVITGVLIANDASAQCPDTPDQVEINAQDKLLDTGDDYILVDIINGGYPDYMAVDGPDQDNWGSTHTEEPNSSIYYQTYANTGIVTIHIKNMLNPSACDEDRDIEIVENLPLDLLSFTAKIDPDTLEVDWETVNMINVDKTEVQISNDGGEDYTTIAREEYDKDHREPLHHTQKVAIDDIMKQLKESGEYQAGREDYVLRLQTTDNDGPVSNSRLISVHIDQKTGEMTFRIVPNIVSPYRSLHLQLSDGLNPEDVKSIDIFNIQGKKVSHFDNIDEVNTNKLTGGTYFVRMITENGKVITKKLVVGNAMAKTDTNKTAGPDVFKKYYDEGGENKAA